MLDGQLSVNTDIIRLAVPVQSICTQINGKIAIFWTNRLLKTKNIAWANAEIKNQSWLTFKCQPFDKDKKARPTIAIGNESQNITNGLSLKKNQPTIGAINTDKLIIKEPSPNCPPILIANIHKITLVDCKQPVIIALGKCVRLIRCLVLKQTTNKIIEEERNHNPIKAKGGISKIASFEETQPTAANIVTSTKIHSPFRLTLIILLLLYLKLVW